VVDTDVRKIKSKHEHFHKKGRRAGKQRMGCLFEDDDGAVRLEYRFDLLRVFLG
jgi:hypothetical protein